MAGKRNLVSAETLSRFYGTDSLAPFGTVYVNMLVERPEDGFGYESDGPLDATAGSPHTLGVEWPMDRVAVASSVWSDPALSFWDPFQPFNNTLLNSVTIANQSVITWDNLDLGAGVTELEVSWVAIYRTSGPSTTYADMLYWDILSDPLSGAPAPRTVFPGATFEFGIGSLILREA